MNKRWVKRSISVLAASALLSGLSLPGLAASGDASSVKRPLGPAEIQRLIEQTAESGGFASMNSTNTDSGAVIASGVDTTSSKSVNVIVQLDKAPAAVTQFEMKQKGLMTAQAEVIQSIDQQQQDFIRAAKLKGIEIKVNYQYDTVLNGMEITIKANQIPELARLIGVKAIHPELTYYPSADTAVVKQDFLNAVTLGEPVSGVDTSKNDLTPLKQIGVDKAWEEGFTGKGLSVAVVDTGVDYRHPDLAAAYKGGYDSYYNDDDPMEDYPEWLGESRPKEGSYHGTHVAGTILGRSENSNSDVQQRGVAYEANLYAYKVLGGPQTTGSSATIIDGIERAVKQGVDVINLSLGSNTEKTPDSPDSIAVNSAALSGVIMVVANGNDGATDPYYYTMGSPASAQFAISVAAATSDGPRFEGSATANLTGTKTYDLPMLSWTMSKENFGQQLGGGKAWTGVYVGLGTEEDYQDAGSLKGKVALISRGDITFDQKLKNAARSGAEAAIIFNGNSKEVKGENVPDLSPSLDGRDGHIGDLAFMGDSYELIPTFDMAGDEGRALARAVLDNPKTELKFTFSDQFVKTVKPGNDIADFSSRGPNSDGNFGIKPDLAAPGVNVLSTLPDFVEGTFTEAYGRLSGTSMATPHVAGLALLLKQKHKDWWPEDIRAALANTAGTLKDSSGTQYDVYSQGAGLVNVDAALHTPALLESLDPVLIHDYQMNPYSFTSYASSVSFGQLDPASSKPVSKPLTLKNMSDNQLTYSAKVVMHDKVTSNPHDLVDTPPSSDVSVILSGLDKDGKLTVKAASQHDFDLVAAVNNKQAKGVYEGEVFWSIQTTRHFICHLSFMLEQEQRIIIF